MGKTITLELNNKSCNRKYDNGEMRWDGEYSARKPIIITLRKCIKEKWLEKKHQRSDGRRASAMNIKWIWIIRPSEDTTTIQQNGINDSWNLNTDGN